tara:strand:+ start:114 stop:635 length:522 start_codon:yes stop_codon:yes gene_type:complete
MKQSVALCFLILFGCRTIAQESDILQGFQIHGYPAIDFVVTAPDGSRAGLDPISNTPFKDIANASYTMTLFGKHAYSEASPNHPTGKDFAMIPPQVGEYQIEVFGVATCQYSLVFWPLKSNGLMVEDDRSISPLAMQIDIKAGEKHTYQFDIDTLDLAQSQPTLRLVRDAQND